MEVSSMEYLRRKNLGNYEHEELKVSGVMEDGESVKEAFQKMKEFVNACLNIEQEDKAQLPLPIEKVNKAVEKAPKSVEKPEEKVAVKEELKEEVKNEAKEKKAESKAKKPASETKPVKKLNKATVYDRALDTHKNLLGSFLDKKYPKWRNADSLKKAAEASKALNGTDFLDDNGEILDSFKLAFSNFMDA